MDQQRIVDVFLHDARPATICRRLFDDALDLVVLSCNLNTVTSICVFTGLNDPDVLRRRRRLIVLRLLLIFLLVRTA